MPWSLDQIERDWLRGARIAYPPEAVVKAFDVVERWLGRAWIEGSRAHPWGSSWGAAPTLHIVRIGLMLTSLEGVAGTNDLIARVRRDERAALAELTAIYLVRNRHPSALLELGPEVALSSGLRRPDFCVRRTPEDTWAYVEVAQPDMSEAEQRVRAVMTRLTEPVQAIKKAFALEVFLRREPSEAELEVLTQRVRDLCLLEGTHVEDLPSGLGLLLLNQSDPGRIVLADHPGEENRPRLGMATAIAGGTESPRHIAVRIAFSDERAERFLTEEARQLPNDAPGLVMVGMSGTPGGFRSWEPLLRRRFQPTMHTRVSAVCLFEGGLVPTPGGEKWLPQTKLLLNPHARLALPQWIAESLTEAGAEHEQLLGRRKEKGSG